MNKLLLVMLGLFVLASCGKENGNNEDASSSSREQSETQATDDDDYRFKSCMRGEFTDADNEPASEEQIRGFCKCMLKTPYNDLDWERESGICERKHGINSYIFGEEYMW